MMFLDLTKVQEKLPNVTQDDLDTLERQIRAYTQNHFLIPQSYLKGLQWSDGRTLALESVRFLQVGDTIELWDTGINDGIYLIESIEASNNTITLDKSVRDTDENPDGYFGLVMYPEDLLGGAYDLIKFDQQGRQEYGVKQETVSRVSKTYYDTTESESRFGYPAFMTEFLEPYMQGSWE